MIQNVAISFGSVGLGTGKSIQCHENENKIQKKFQNSNSSGGVLLAVRSVPVSIFQSLFLGPAASGFGND